MLFTFRPLGGSVSPHKRARRWASDHPEEAGIVFHSRKAHREASKLPRQFVSDKSLAAGVQKKNNITNGHRSTEGCSRRSDKKTAPLSVNEVVQSI